MVELAAKEANKSRNKKITMYRQRRIQVVWFAALLAQLKRLVNMWLLQLRHPPQPVTSHKYQFDCIHLRHMILLPAIILRDGEISNAWSSTFVI